MKTWLATLTFPQLIAVAGWLSTGFYLLWFLRDSGIERDLFRNTEDDKQAYLLVIGTWALMMGALMLCLGMLSQGGTMVTGGISMLIGKSWLDQNTQKTITTAQIASQTTIATTSTTTATEKPKPSPAAKPKPKPKSPGEGGKEGSSSLLSGGEGR